MKRRNRSVQMCIVLGVGDNGCRRTRYHDADCHASAAAQWSDGAGARSDPGCSTFSHSVTTGANCPGRMLKLNTPKHQTKHYNGFHCAKA